MAALVFCLKTPYSQKSQQYMFKEQEAGMRSRSRSRSRRNGLLGAGAGVGAVKKLGGSGSEKVNNNGKITEC